MNKKYFKLLYLFVAMAIAIPIVFAKADTGENATPPTFTLTSVTPDMLNPNQDTTLTITGTGFGTIGKLQVQLGEYGDDSEEVTVLANASVVNSTTISAVVPTGTQINDQVPVTVIDESQVPATHATLDDAIGGGNMPSSSDPFWQLTANLDRPDDSNCAGEIETEKDDNPQYQNMQIPVSQICSGISQMPTQMKQGMAAHGVTTNLFDQSNWHNVSNLYFEHSTNGVLDGKIQFTKPIDFMSYDFMQFMNNFGKEMDMKQGVLGLDASVVGGMQNYGAILTMYNIPNYKNPVILVNGEQDKSNVVSNIVYDATSHTITFNAAHFTTFSVVDKSSLKKLAPKISSITTSLNTSTGVLTVTITGSNFGSDSKVTLGKTKATAVTFNSSTSLTATFVNSKLKAGKLTLSVVNSNHKKASHVLSNVFAQLITAKITANNSNSLTVALSNGKSIKVDLAGAKLLRKFNGKATIDEMQVGDTVKITGTWTDATHAELLATYVKDISIQKSHFNFIGTVSSLTNNGFVMKARGSQTVTILNTTLLRNKANQAITQSQIVVGNKVTVKGLWNSHLKTITETSLVKDLSI